MKSRKPSKVFGLEDFEYLRTLGKLVALMRRVWDVWEGEASAVH